MTTVNTTEERDESVEETTDVKSKKQTVLESVFLEFNQRIKDSLELQRQMLVDSLVSKELDERVVLLEASLKKRVELARDVKKSEKPDVKTFDKTGATVSEGFSSEALKKLNEAQQKLGKMDAAIELALSQNSFDKLREMK